MTNFKLVKAECAKAMTFEGRYNGCKVYILAKEAISSKNKPIVQFYLGCEFYQDFKAVYEIPEGTEINTEKGFFEVAHKLLHDNIKEIVEQKYDGDVDYRDIYENDAIRNDAEDDNSYEQDVEAELDTSVFEDFDEDEDEQFFV